MNHSLPFKTHRWKKKSTGGILSIQKRTQNHSDKKKKKLGLLRNYFLILKISIFLHSSLHIEVMEKDNTFLRVIILAHQESGSFWWSEALLRRDLAADWENASLSQSWNASNPRRSWGTFFFFFWLHWVFVAARGLPLVAGSGGYSSLRCAGFSLRWLLLLQSTGSRRTGFSSCGSRALERRLSSCGARASLLWGMWDLPRPGLEPMCPALAGGVLTTAPPGKSKTEELLKNYICSYCRGNIFQKWRSISFSKSYGLLHFLQAC